MLDRRDELLSLRIFKGVMGKDIDGLLLMS